MPKLHCFVLTLSFFDKFFFLLDHGHNCVNLPCLTKLVSNFHHECLKSLSIWLVCTQSSKPYEVHVYNLKKIIIWRWLLSFKCQRYTFRLPIISYCFYNTQSRIKGSKGPMKELITSFFCGGILWHLKFISTHISPTERSSFCFFLPQPRRRWDEWR